MWDSKSGFVLARLCVLLGRVGVLAVSLLFEVKAGEGEQAGRRRKHKAGCKLGRQPRSYLAGCFHGLAAGVCLSVCLSVCVSLFSLNAALALSPSAPMPVLDRLFVARLVARVHS